MKHFYFFALLSLCVAETTKAAEKSYCATPPEGSYKNSCTEISIESHKDEFGISVCTLKARCKTPPATRQKTVLTTLRMDEGHFGPHTPCKDIGVADKSGHLQCVTSRETTLEP